MPCTRVHFAIPSPPPPTFYVMAIRANQRVRYGMVEFCKYIFVYLFIFVMKFDEMRMLCQMKINIKATLNEPFL